MASKEKKQTAAEKLQSFLEDEKIVLSGKVIPDEETTNGRLILRAGFTAEYKK